jgi:hypothetical protein
LNRLYDEHKVSKSSKLAVILPTAIETLQFYKTVGINRGWMVELFSERQEAIDWLKQVQQ